jgi:hypothetical protein
VAEENCGMQAKPYVFGYEAEPANERPTDFGSTNFGHSGIAALSTVAAPWTASEHSTFDEPSHSFDRVRALRVRSRRRSAGLAAVAFAVLAIVAAALGKIVL